MERSEIQIPGIACVIGRRIARDRDDIHIIPVHNAVAIDIANHHLKTIGGLIASMSLMPGAPLLKGVKTIG